MLETAALNSSQSTNLSSPYLKNIINKKVTDVALTCFESFVHWFLTTFSFLYPAYNNFYKAKIVELSAEPREPLPQVEETAKVSEPVKIQEPVIKRFLRGGELLDYTANTITGLCINSETHYRDGKAYEFLTLNSYKVIRWGRLSSDRNGNFACDIATDQIIVKDSVEHPGKIEIQEYSNDSGIQETHIVDPTKIYLRQYLLPNGYLLREHVYLTDTAMTEDPQRPGYLTLT